MVRESFHQPPAMNTLPKAQPQPEGDLVRHVRLQAARNGCSYRCVHGVLGVTGWAKLGSTHWTTTPVGLLWLPVACGGRAKAGLVHGSPRRRSSQWTCSPFRLRPGNTRCRRGREQRRLQRGVVQTLRQWPGETGRGGPPRVSGDLWRGWKRVSLQLVLQRAYSLNSRVIGMLRNPRSDMVESMIGVARNQQAAMRG